MTYLLQWDGGDPIAVLSADTLTSLQEKVESALKDHFCHDEGRVWAGHGTNLTRYQSLIAKESSMVSIFADFIAVDGTEIRELVRLHKVASY